MKEKFDSIRTRLLYSRTTIDEEVGSSSEGIGWGGLYMRWEGVGGYILSEDTDGFVSSETYDTDEDLTAAWDTLCDFLEFSGSPEDGDFVVMTNPKTAEYFSLMTGEGVMFSSLDAIVNELDQEPYNTEHKPNIWFLNERGNFIPIAVVELDQE